VGFVDGQERHLPSCTRQLWHQRAEPLGAQYSRARLPDRVVSRIARRSAGESRLFRYAAGIARRRSAATWSCISEIKGETTSVRPRAKSAGSW